MILCRCSLLILSVLRIEFILIRKTLSLLLPELQLGGAAQVVVVVAELKEVCLPLRGLETSWVGGSQSPALSTSIVVTVGLNGQAILTNLGQGITAIRFMLGSQE